MLLRLDRRKIDRELCASADFALYVKETAMRFNDIEHRRKPESRSLSDLFRRKERVENALDRFFGHSMPRILNGYQNVTARCHLRAHSVVALIDRLISY